MNKDELIEEMAQAMADKTEFGSFWSPEDAWELCKAALEVVDKKLGGLQSYESLMDAYHKVDTELHRLKEQHKWQPLPPSPEEVNKLTDI